MEGHSKEVSAEFSAFPNDERDALLAAHLQAKREKENAAKKLSNVSISKAVDSKIRLVTSTVCFIILSQSKSEFSLVSETQLSVSDRVLGFFQPRGFSTLISTWFICNRGGSELGAKCGNW